LTTPEAKSKGVPLPPEFIERWKRFFPSLDLRRVRVHWGIPARLTRLAGIPNPAAVSYRYHIYVDPRYADLNSPHGTRVILHELRHVAQWRAFGDRLYTMYQEANRRGYWRNPLEQDAYRYERLILAAVP
jgi:hypothetical protein